ncbi:hypothetical protein AB4Z46_32445 [Variovorax sp. M-6]|uniref:hypothetical protein n=1 Tax=Variovorax sp. M-6 TaxID=3233041 RepID=UPI003F9584B7
MKIESGPTAVGRQVDAFEMKVRLGCGALLGLVVGLGLCIRLWPLSTFGACLLVACSILACGFGAARYGDRFWANLRWLQ